MHTKTKNNTEPPQTMGVHKTINQQHQSHRLRMDATLSYLGRKCILLVPNFALYYVVVKTKNA